MKEGGREHKILIIYLLNKGFFQKIGGGRKDEALYQASKMEECLRV